MSIPIVPGAIARTSSSNKHVPARKSYQIDRQIMKRRLFLFLALAIFASTLPASPTPPPSKKRTSAKNEKKGGAQTISKDLAQSANGWTYVKGEWVHPEGYKYVNGKILRTTARLGQAIPKPPGKLALENPEKLTPTPAPVLDSASKAAADKAAERARNLSPKPASQTGTHL